MTVEEGIPMGTVARGILATGINASTSFDTKNNPSPVIVKITSDGYLPLGFKAKIKDSVVIAACYGDLSSERAICSLDSFMLTENNGEVHKKKIEGWLIGEDGIPGIKGIVVDKAGAPDIFNTFDKAGASDTSNALNRIAEYTINRVEQIQPFISVNSGRRVTVIFKSDVDLSNSMVRKKLYQSTYNQRMKHAEQEAAQSKIQIKEFNDDEE